MNVSNSAVTSESEQAAASGDKIHDSQVSTNDVKEDMSTCVLSLLTKAVTEDDFITAICLLEEHWEMLTVWSDDNYYSGIFSDLRDDCRAMLRNVKTLSQTSSKEEIWKLSLYISCLRGYIQLTELLLNKGASATWRLGNDNNTPLHVAVFENHPKIVHFLLQTDPSCVNIQNHDDCTALHLAAIEAKAEIVHLLLEYGADVKLVDDSGDTVLHHACESGSEYIVECLLKHSRSTINSTDCGGSTALHVAARKRNTKIVKLLLNSNEIADVYDQHKGHSLENFTNQETVDWNKKDNLLKHLIMHREQGDLCVTPLDILTCYTCCEKIEQLKETAADVNVTNFREETALDVAIDYENLEVVQLLLKHGAQCKEMYNVETYDAHIEIIESLLMYGDYINFTDVSDCVRNVFLIDEVDVELFQYFIRNIRHSLDGCVVAINKLFFENTKLVRLFLCCGIRIKYLNDKYDKTRLPPKIYYFVRWCVAWLEKKKVRFVKINADGEYVIEFSYYEDSHRRIKDSFLEQLNGKSAMELLDDCVKETEVMKSRRLGDTDLTLFNLVEADLNRLVKYLGNNKLLHALKKENNFSEFPICGKILQTHIDRGLKRRLLIEKCVQYFPLAYPGYPTLVLEILEPTFHTLSNRDLYAFSFACNSLI